MREACSFTRSGFFKISKISDLKNINFTCTKFTTKNSILDYFESKNIIFKLSKIKKHIDLVCMKNNCKSVEKG